MTPSRVSRFAASLIVGIAVFAVTDVRAQSRDGSALIEKLRNLQLDQLGNPQIKSDSIPPVLSTPDAPHRLLIIPVEYPNLGFDRFRGDASADDLNRQYLADLLFSTDLETPREGTLTHYYYHQSKGRYYVTGEVLPTVTVAEASEYYGKPIQNSDGQWRNDVRAELLVEDALTVAYERNPEFPWSEFDTWDPQDFDGDGVYDESDGYIDHFVL